jgi:hypothetical protein
VAKADEESTYRTDVISSADAVGLEQVRTLHAGKGGGPTGRDEYREWLKDPCNNFAAAKAVYASQGWGAWRDSGGSPNVNDSHRRAVEDMPVGGPTICGGSAVGPLGDVDPSIPDVIPDVAGALAQALEYVRAAATWITDRRNMGRIAFVLIGGIVTMGALVTLAKPVLEETASTVGKVVP